MITDLSTPAPLTLSLYFIYDSHCPWSYAATPLVNALSQAYSEMDLNLMHCAHFDGSDAAGQEQVDAILSLSSVKFGKEHIRYVNSPKDSLKTANFMAWIGTKQPDKLLPVLNALQKSHFVEGNAFNCKPDFNDLIKTFKLSPSKKVFRDQLSSEAELVLGNIEEIQDMIVTTAFPVLLIIADEQGIFIDHSLYLSQPERIVDAVEKELEALKF